MSDDIAIKVDNVSKTFKLPHEKQNSVKGIFVNILKRKRSFEKQKVLHDISFEVKKGDFYGIVGRNGSGKSTLLKLLAGIYAQDSGNVTVNGKLTPFIELGVGFSPELTGRENVFLNGALLGFNRKEMVALYDEIVEFAELGKFMDQKLKNYSSGMQVRLAFSIAIQAKTDILLLDEVLAVGDEAFQKKCLAVFERYKANGQTIILVTHAMSVVEKFCNKAILIDQGSIIQSGSPRKVANQYSLMNNERYQDYKYAQEEKKRAKKNLSDWKVTVNLLDSNGKPSRSYCEDSKVKLRVTWSGDDIKNVGVALLKQSGEYMYGANTVLDKYKINKHSVDYILNLNLGAGEYGFKIGLFGSKEEESLLFIDEGPKFIVKSRNTKRLWEGLTKLNHYWE